MPTSNETNNFAAKNIQYYFQWGKIKSHIPVYSHFIVLGPCGKQSWYVTDIWNSFTYTHLLVALFCYCKLL